MEAINKQKIIQIILVLVIGLVLFWGVSKLLENRSPLAKTALENYISENASFTIPTTSITSYCPKVLLSGQAAQSVNEEINTLYNDIVGSDDRQLLYQAAISDRYLSLVLIVNTYDDEENKEGAYPTFSSYIFDIHTKELLTSDTVLQAFHKTQQVAEQIFQQEMKTHYQKELESGYLKEAECDYECFLDLRNIEDDPSAFQYYIEDGKLKFFRGFHVFSIWGEEDYYRNEDFLFSFE